MKEEKINDKELLLKLKELKKILIINSEILEKAGMTKKEIDYQNNMVADNFYNCFKKDKKTITAREENIKILSEIEEMEKEKKSINENEDFNEETHFLNNFGNKFYELEYYDEEKTKLKSIHSFECGMRNGEEKDFYENGNIKNIKIFVSGKVDIEEKDFYESGILSEEYGYKNDDKYSDVLVKKYYNPSGLIHKYEECNRRWQEHGFFVIYDEEGSIILISKYDNGSLL